MCVHTYIRAAVVGFLNVLRPYSDGHLRKVWIFVNPGAHHNTCTVSRECVVFQSSMHMAKCIVYVDV